MSELKANERLIRRCGHNVTNEMTGETLQMVRPDGQCAKFPLGANVLPGHVIYDPAQRSRYLVGEVRPHIGQQFVHLYPFHLTGCITRCVGGAKDSFGRDLGEPAIVADEVPLVWGGGLFHVTDTVDVAQGDVIHVVSIAETFLVRAIGGTTPGLRKLAVSKQDVNTMMQGKAWG